MTLKGPSHLDEEQIFATHVSHDIQFPKHSDEYHDISNYLELNVNYLDNMDIFDRVWEKYQENNR